MAAMRASRLMKSICSARMPNSRLRSACDFDMAAPSRARILIRRMCQEQRRAYARRGAVVHENPLSAADELGAVGELGAVSRGNRAKFPPRATHFPIVS